jgi:ubiquinone/menaquinone biosynthesis C-methylase UbiE
MSLEILQNKNQIEEARKELDKKQVSYIDKPDPYIKSVMRRFGIIKKPIMGDNLKSWDVLQTLNFLDKNLKKNDPILDIGCYSSEILASLHKSGYSRLTGADLNTNLGLMPFQENIEYVITDFMKTKFENSSFKAITSISVIEHNFNSDLLLTEMSRLIKKDGYFIASFDYWPEKIDTHKIKFFGMDWLIFSKNDVKNFINKASHFGFLPAGEINYDTGEKPIRCAEKEYTFAWLALKKSH